MKKNALIVLTIFVSFCFMLFACRKDIKNYIDNKVEGSPAQLESAKIWRLQNLENNEWQKGISILKPLWKDSWTLRSSKGYELLIVPAPEHHIQNKDLSIRRFFVFKTSQNETIDGQIIELLGNKYNVEDNIDKLLVNCEESNIENFNGSILFYDINYHDVKSTSYTNGTKSNSRSSIVKTTLNSLLLTTSRGANKTLEFLLHLVPANLYFLHGRVGH